MQDDAFGLRFFSEISRFPRPCIPALLHSHVISPSSTFKISQHYTNNPTAFDSHYFQLNPCCATQLTRQPIGALGFYNGRQHCARKSRRSGRRHLAGGELSNHSAIVAPVLSDAEKKRRRQLSQSSPAAIKITATCGLASYSLPSRSTQQVASSSSTVELLKHKRNAGRLRSVRTVRLEEVIRQHIDNMTSTSTRSITREMGCRRPPVAQSVSASPIWGAGGSGFESRSQTALRVEAIRQVMSEQESTLQLTRFEAHSPHTFQSIGHIQKLWEYAIFAFWQNGDKKKGRTNYECPAGNLLKLNFPFSCLGAAAYKGELGSIPDRVTSGFSHVRIVPDDAAGRRVFSGISRFPSPFSMMLLHSHSCLMFRWAYFFLSKLPYSKCYVNLRPEGRAGFYCVSGLTPYSY
ncbi:hypothetical protein PR048_025894 [Dryococelus australis]|uniref:Uncharacterized protein n=1 Tax=Dryococelus australis TaxID=614101 RepID=A0ABQ9GJT2_9NEOP|nr:hypothetical protein PR048_025894 [Dryococelus australis]